MFLDPLSPKQHGYTSTLAYKLIHKHRILSKSGNKAGPTQGLHLDYLAPHHYDPALRARPSLCVDFYATNLSTPSERKPVFTQRLRSRVIQESKHVKLTCQVDGNPSPTIVWMKGRNELSPGDPHMEIRNVHGTCTLEMNSCRMGDMAEYICQAENVHGCDQTSAFLFVERQGKKPKEVIEPIHITDFDEPDVRKTSLRQRDELPTEEIKSKPRERKIVQFPPRIVEDIQGLTVYEGATIMLQCRVDGKPMPSAKWIHNESELTASNNVEIKGDPDCPTLLIRNISPAHGGEYACIVTNSGGTASTSAEVVVKEAPGGLRKRSKDVSAEGIETTEDVEETGETSETRLQGQEGDQALSPQEEVVEGSSTESLPGSPKAVKEDSASVEQPGHDVSTEMEAEEEPSGVQSKEEQEIDATEVPISEEVDQDGVGSGGIRIVKHLQGMTIGEGESMRLECAIEGIAADTCEAVWVRNGKTIPDNPDFERQQIGCKFVLNITEMFKEDSGSFGIQITNGAYQATSACSVIVQDEEGLDPSVSEFPQSITTMPGSTVDFSSKIAGSQPMTVQWQTPDGNGIEDGTKYSLSGPDSTGECKLAINDVASADDGTYQLNISNSESELTLTFVLQVLP